MRRYDTTTLVEGAMALTLERCEDGWSEVAVRLGDQVIEGLSEKDVLSLQTLLAEYVARYAQGA